MDFIDDFLNKITMYRLVLYFLIVLIVLGMGLSFFHLLPYSPLSIVMSALFLVLLSMFINSLWARIFGAPTNVESSIITGLILSLIVTPASSMEDVIFLAEVSILAITAKYLLSIKKKHLFNPAAVAILVAPYLMGQGPSWWVGNVWMNLPVAVGGYLIVRKIKREKMLASFLITFFVLVALIALSNGFPVMSVYSWLMMKSSLWFFSLIMLTEPQTSPTMKKWQIVYGALVGALSVPGVHLGSFYFSYEAALIVGNVFAYLVNSKEKLILKLGERVRTGADLYDFVFPLKQKLSFLPGQYMEWTLPGDKADSRGNRRYFTVASSPTEKEIRLGVKFHNPSSSFKSKLLEIDSKTPIVGDQLAGEFVLPKEKNKKLVFVAGGIGITPFRSMLKYLIDTKEKRDIVVMYSNKEENEIVYKDVLDEAEKVLGVRTVYSLTEMETINKEWKGIRGRIDEKVIQESIPDFREREFYLSGPRSMVEGFKKTLTTLGVKQSQIKTDYFPGYA